MSRYSRYDIYLAEFEFEDHPGVCKVRPVVILDEETVVVLAVKITSHAPRYNDPLDYSIIEWKKAGLLRPSTIRVSKILKINKTHMYNRLGRLQPIDIKNLDNLLSKITL